LQTDRSKANLNLVLDQVALLKCPYKRLRELHISCVQWRYPQIHNAKLEEKIKKSKVGKYKLFMFLGSKGP